MIPFPVQRDATRSVAPRRRCAKDGFAHAISGVWQGCGFRLAVRPARAADAPCFLAMHPTSERLSVAAADTVYDREIEPSTLAYDQTVADLASGARLDHDAGMWFAHPASSSERRCGQALTLFSTMADGALTIASGCAITTHDPLGDVTIPPVNTAPFVACVRPPEAGRRGAFAPYDLRDHSPGASRCRTTIGAAWASAFAGLSPQAVLDDPTCLLRATVGRQIVERLTTAHVANNAALDLLASAVDAVPLCDPTFAATFWIERVREAVQPSISFNMCGRRRRISRRPRPARSSSGHRSVSRRCVVSRGRGIMVFIETHALCGRGMAGEGTMTVEPERRADERTNCNIEAKVELGDGRVIACRIKDLSPTGFKMQISDVIYLPDELDLLIPVIQGVDQRCRARLVWRDVDLVGGVFLTPLGQ